MSIQFGLQSCSPGVAAANSAGQSPISCETSWLKILALAHARWGSRFDVPSDDTARARSVALPIPVVGSS
jgi:hypothetical protein